MLEVGRITIRLLQLPCHTGPVQRNQHGAPTRQLQTYGRYANTLTYNMTSGATY